MTYKEQLQTPEWKDKRHQILARDLHMCKQCGTNKSLNVHHTSYIKGKMAWEYPNSMLETLCYSCHKTHHGVDDHDKIKKSFQNIGSAMAGIKGLSRG